MNIFIICPVRNVPVDVAKKIAIYVHERERQGYIVHWPSRDTHQNDPVGLNICLANADALHMAVEVHIWYDATSQGTVFDLGMLLMSSITIGPKKKVVLINPEDVHATPTKSFTNIVIALAGDPLNRLTRRNP